MSALDEIHSVIDDFRELLERAAEAGVDVDLIERSAATLPCLLLELAEHRRHAFDPRRAASIKTARRLWAAKELMRGAGFTPREINAALRDRFGFSKSRTNALLKEAEAACVLPSRLGATLQTVPKLTQRRSPSEETDKSR